MNDMFSLKGKIAIVTGGNQGLGQGICEAFAKMGCNIVSVARKDSALTKEICEKYKVKFLEIKADLSNRESINMIIGECNKNIGIPDILVNNAGMIIREPITDITTSWDKVLDLNLDALFFLSQAFSNNLIKNNKKGKIINICSMLSYQGGINVASYTASKSAVMGLTKAFCNELAGKGINCNAIAPGYMETDNTKEIQNNPERYNEILRRIPQGRWGKKEDIMGAAIYLASSASDYVNGFTIAVDGGWLAR